jgi:transposase-like protein
MEIITGTERRRRWRVEEKLRIVAEVEEAGACFADVARRHEVSRGLLWNWRRQVRRGSLAPEAAPMFTPVQITADPPLPHPPMTTLSPAPSSGVPVATVSDRIEIALPDGTCIRVGADVGINPPSMIVSCWALDVR